MAHLVESVELLQALWSPERVEAPETQKLWINALLDVQSVKSTLKTSFCWCSLVEVLGTDGVVEVKNRKITWA